MCPGSFVLVGFDDRSIWAEGGQEKHDHLEDVIEGNAEPDFDFQTIKESMLDGDESAVIVSEAAFWYDANRDVAEALGRKLGRDYSKAPTGSIPGTMDLYSVSADWLRLGDLKSGFQWIKRPESNPQIEIYALMLARHFKRREVEAFIFKQGQDGEVMPIPHVFERAELMEIAADVFAEVQEIAIARQAGTGKATTRRRLRAPPGLLQ